MLTLGESVSRNAGGPARQHAQEHLIASRARRALVPLVALGLIGSLAHGPAGAGVALAAGQPERDDATATGPSPRTTIELDVSGRRTTQQPNVVLITADDQTDTEMRFMPRTRRLLGRAGVDFTDAINPHPLCCPARAELVTGEYGHNNGVLSNAGAYGGYSAFIRKNLHSNLAAWLQAGGYRTAFIGKTLNGYSAKAPAMDGWDYWSPTIGGTYAYYGSRFLNNGHPRRYRKRYVVDVVADQAVDRIERFSAAGRPFFVWASHVAPHTRKGKHASGAAEDGAGWLPPRPADRHRKRYRDLGIWTAGKASYRESDVSDKNPRVIARRPVQSAGKLRSLIRARARTLQAVDEANARVIRALARTGQLENTVVIYLSDNGYLLGEHRMQGKNEPYQESLQIPLLMRGPGIAPGSASTEPATLVDVAPTILDYAGLLDGVRALGRTDGESLRPAIAGTGRLSSTSLIQAGRIQTGLSESRQWEWRGVRTERYTYLRRQKGFEELYDRDADPFELQNLAGDPAVADVLADLRGRAEALAGCAGVAACERSDFPIPTGGSVG
ncbi:sulfatase [Nocardioides sp. YIM 152588]|uniref:sulfatase family protein n=1 Tax=Nocardioides sp. YIM 152588 TaxID=3158259 RepID=UPI0032E4B78C